MPIKTRQLQALVGADRRVTTTLQLLMPPPAIPGHLKAISKTRQYPTREGDKPEGLPGGCLKMLESQPKQRGTKGLP